MDIQADAETVDHIVEAFNRAEDAIGEKDLDALMMVYSEHYRYQDLTKADMRKTWRDFSNNTIESRPCIRSLALSSNQGNLERLRSPVPEPCGRHRTGPINE